MTSDARRLFFELPLLRREFVALLRTRRAFWLLFFSLVVAGTLTLLFWTELEGQRTLLRTARVERLFAIFMILQLVVATLIVPAFAATAICGEREAKTADMLYTTLLSPLSIVFSKWLSATGYIAILLVAGSPIVSALYLLGGISWDGVVHGYALTLLTVGVAGITCLAASVRSEQTSQAVVRGMAGTIFWNGVFGVLCCLGLVIVKKLFDVGPVAPQPYLQGIMATLTPFYSLAEATLTGIPALPTPLGSYWQGYLVYMSIVGLTHLFYLLWRVRSPESIAAVRGSKKKNNKKNNHVRPQTRFSASLVNLLDGIPAVPLNPLLVREIRHDVLSRLWIRRVLFWVPLAIFVAFALYNHSFEVRLAAPAITSVLFFLLLIPSIPAASLPRELERGTLDSLRSTLLTPRQIVLAKYSAGVFAGSGVLAAAFVFAFGAAILRLSTRPDYPVGLALAGALSVPTFTLLFYCAVGTLASVLAQRSLPALLMTYGTGLFLHLGFPLLLLLAHEINLFSFPRSGEGFIAATNAFVAAVQVLDWRSRHEPYGFLIFHGGGTILALVSAVQILKRRDTAR